MFSALNPLLLYALPVAAIPIILHLLTLHRLKTVELSTFRFLFDSYVQQRRRMKFLEALIALLRTLFLLFLVFVVARPAVKHWNELFGFGQGTGRDVVMLLDSSVSMNTTTAGMSSFDRAKSAALSIAERLGTEDRLTLVRVGSRPEEVFSRFTTDSEAIRDKIESLRVGSSRANLYAALNHVFGPEAPARSNTKVYLFTDGQGSGWREVREQDVQAERLVPADTEFTVVHVGSNEAVSNRALIGDAPRRQRTLVGLPVRMRPRVVNHSKTETVDVTVSVLLDEKEVARVPMTLKPGETQTKEVIHIPQEPGVLKGRFEIERNEASTDRFPHDDSFLFALNVEPPLKVLIVNGHPVLDPLENETLFLTTALTVGGDDEPLAADLAKMGVSKEFVRSLELREIPEPQLNAETLRETSVLIVANCGAMNDAQFTAIRDFVTRGGGLLIFPGDRVNPDVYTKQFFVAATNPDQRLVAAQFIAADGTPDKPETFQHITPDTIDFAHPVLSVFDHPESRYLTTAHFYRRFPIKLMTGVPTDAKAAPAVAKPAVADAAKATPNDKPAEKKSVAAERATAKCWPLAAFADGQPALVESWCGEGIVLLAAFPAHTRWSNLPLKPEFVPLVLRMVSHVAQRPALDAPSVVLPEAKAEISVTGDWEPAAGKVTNAAGHTTPLTFLRSKSRLVSVVTDTADKGYYTVDVKGGRAAAKAGTTQFAVNLSPDESNFQDAVREDQLREWLPGEKLKMIDASAQAQQEHGEIGNQQEIWRPLIWIMFAIIAVEFLLSTLGTQKLDTDEDATISERLQAINPGTWVGRMTGGGVKG
ncbi:MAG: VWA domain-containing protein [Planctomycetales bacterium]|nr:VWA domain-containing protein [Planctomycetales bacterium]